MSKRHQDGKPVRIPRAERKKANRTVRHQVAQQLHTVADPDDVTLTEHRVEHTRRPAQRRRRRTLRHWKLKSWKRRTVARRQRNEALTLLAAGDE